MFASIFGHREESHNGIAFIRNNALFCNWDKEEVVDYIDSLYPEEIEGLKAFVADNGVLLFDDEVAVGSRASLSFALTENGPQPVITVNRRVFTMPAKVKGLMEHELTHYRQYKRGDIQVDNDGVALYKGQTMANPYSPLVFFGEMEMEARQAQADLVAKYSKAPRRLINVAITAAILIGV